MQMLVSIILQMASVYKEFRYNIIWPSRSSLTTSVLSRSVLSDVTEMVCRWRSEKDSTRTDQRLKRLNNTYLSMGACCAQDSLKSRVNIGPCRGLDSMAFLFYGVSITLHQAFLEVRVEIRLLSNIPAYLLSQSR